MPKISHQVRNYASKSAYTRAPIHRKPENEEENIDDEEEEDEENNSNLHQTLYPDLSEDLRNLQNISKSKVSGRRGKKAEQLVMSENSDSNSHTSTVNFTYITFLLTLLISAIGIFLYTSPKKASDKIDVAKLVTDMQNHFQMKNPDTFKILNRALTKVVNEKPEPSAPAIFTVLANKGAETTASDFSLHLAEALAPGSFVSINESLRWRNNPEQLKYDIDTEIRSKLENGILNVVIVDRLNDIPIDAAIIFHSFCDSDYAPFKRAVYVFIVHLGRRIPENSTTKDIDAVAMESLKNIWGTDDGVDSLITRITVNVLGIL